MKAQFLKFSFAAVVNLPKNYEVFDFSKGYDPKRKTHYSYGVGKFNEKRPAMYTSEIYEEGRDIHMGVDIMAPLGEEVRSFYDGEIYCFTNNDQPLDYGYTLITKHKIEDMILYALYGHLSEKSISDKKIGQKIEKGEVVAWIGSMKENGGWNPHLHFQISLKEPKACDMPGVVHQRDLAEALKTYIDPRLVLGPIY